MNIPFLRRRRSTPAVTPHEHHQQWREAALWLDYPRARIQHGQTAIEPDERAGGAEPSLDAGPTPNLAAGPAAGAPGSEQARGAESEPGAAVEPIGEVRSGRSTGAESAQVAAPIPHRGGESASGRSESGRVEAGR